MCEIQVDCSQLVKIWRLLSTIPRIDSFFSFPESQSNQNRLIECKKLIESAKRHSFYTRRPALACRRHLHHRDLTLRRFRRSRNPDHAESLLPTPDPVLGGAGHRIYARWCLTPSDSTRSGTWINRLIRLIYQHFLLPGLCLLYPPAFNLPNPHTKSTFPIHLYNEIF